MTNGQIIYVHSPCLERSKEHYLKIDQEIRIFEIEIHLNRLLSPKCTVKYKYNS